MNRSMKAAVLAVGVLALGGCDLDLQDPNLPTEDNALTTIEGVAAVAVGLQAEYGNQLDDPIYVVGLVADEVGAGAATFQTYQDVDAGGEIDNNLSPVEGPWSGQYRVIKIANDLVRVTPSVGFGPGTTTGIVALAKLYKAMAIGNLAAIYPSFPLDVGAENPNPAFVDRAVALQQAVTLLEEARASLQATAPSTEFNTRILAPGLDLANTIDAMIARFALMAGDDATALAAAQRVDLNVLSEFRFSASDRNPLYELWYNSGNAYQMRPEDAFRLEAETGDARVAFWVQEDTIQGANGPLDHLNRYRDGADAIPVYFPDEMRLIQAEIYVRRDEIDTALPLINAVRTQCDPVLDEPAACLPALDITDLPDQATALDEILNQRRYELFLQGLRWEDLRRFGKPVKYEFMPWPQSECDRNASAPC